MADPAPLMSASLPVDYFTRKIDDYSGPKVRFHSLIVFVLVPMLMRARYLRFRLPVPIRLRRA